jgi:hypothetical protein
MDGKLVTINGQTAFVYYNEERKTLDIITMHDLSHRLQTVRNGVNGIQVFDNPVEVIDLAIAIVDTLAAKDSAT